MRFQKCFLFACVAGTLLAQAPLRDDSNDVVAAVAGKDITKADLRLMLASAEPSWVDLFKNNPQFALSQFFIMRQLGKEAEEQKLDQQSPVKEQIEYMRLSYLAGARLNQEANGYQVSNDQIAAYYKEHKALFERVHIRGIYIAFKPQAAATGTTPQDVQAAAIAALNAAANTHSETEARALALESIKQLRAGEDFTKVMNQFSEDAKLKAKGGVIGTVTPRTDYPDAFRKAALALKVGDVSEPLRMSAGFYVIQADETGMQDVSEVAGDIAQELRKDHLDAFNKALNDKFRPVIKDNSVFTQPKAFVDGR